MAGGKDRLMVFVRIKSRFRHRAAEWFCAANMMFWGLSMVHPSNVFDTGVAYRAFERTITENLMGTVLAIAGLLWLVGLVINGAREKVTSVIRGVCALFGGIVYFVMALGFLSSYFITGVLTGGVSTHFLTSALAFYSLYWIAKDKRTSGNGPNTRAYKS